MNQYDCLLRQLGANLSEILAGKYLSGWKPRKFFRHDQNLGHHCPFCKAVMKAMPE